MKGFTYRGIRKNFVTLLEKERPYAATRKRELITVPRRSGGYLSDTTIESLLIPMKILIEAPNHDLLLDRVEELSDWLYSEQPEPLVFDDEPDRTFYAVVDGEITKEERNSFAIVSFTFLCPDPHKYGAVKTRDFNGSIQTIINNGTADALPIFRGTAKGDITNLDIVTLEAYMRVGAPAQVGTTVIQPETKMMTDEMATLTGWSPATTIDNGHVAGTMSSDGAGFRAATWGAVMTPAQWQGPVVKKSLPSPLQNFRADISFQQLNGVLEAGMIEIYFLDAAGNIISKMGFSDEWRDTKTNQAKLQLGPIGNRVSLNKQAANAWNWNDFKGIMRMKRTGKQFEAYFAKVDSKGVHNTRATMQFTDTRGVYQAPVAQIQVAIRKWPDSDVPPTDMRVDKIEVWRMNNTTPADPVYVAKAGDQIEINHKTGIILVNGEPKLWLKDFGSSFFPLKRGENIISYSPTALADLSVEWQERFL